MIDLATALAMADPAGPAMPASVELWTIAAATTTTVTVVNPRKHTLVLPRMRSYTTPVIGDVVLVLRAGSSGWVLGAFGVQPVTAPVDPGVPTQPSTGVTGSTTFLPTYTGSWRGSGWRGDTADVIQGDWGGFGRNTGAGYYGGAPTGLGAATATSAALTVRRAAGGVSGAQAPTLRLLGPQGGAPVLLASATGPGLTVGQQADIGITLSWAQQLIAGTAGGIGIHVDASTPYVRLNGRHTFAAAMALRIDWRRDA